MNEFKSARKVSVKYKLSLLKFFQIYLNYDKEKFQYWDQIARKLNINLIRGIIETISNGVMIFIAIYWIWSFWRLSKGIWFGWTEILFQIISLGVFSKLVRESYRFFKETWRQGINEK